jgi:hypothetical protein
VAQLHIFVEIAAVILHEIVHIAPVDVVLAEDLLIVARQRDPAENLDHAKEVALDEVAVARGLLGILKVMVERAHRAGNLRGHPEIDPRAQLPRGRVSPLRGSHNVMVDEDLQRVARRRHGGPDLCSHSRRGRRI